MSKRKARVMFFKTVSLGTLALLGVCAYQLSKLVNVIDGLLEKIDLFEVAHRLIE
jgi:hypothetical protein